MTINKKCTTYEDLMRTFCDNLRKIGMSLDFCSRLSYDIAGCAWQKYDYNSG